MQPTGVEPIIKAGTAKLTVLPALLAIAGEVIE
jgi:hypothetical protein